MVRGCERHAHTDPTCWYKNTVQHTGTFCKLQSTEYEHHTADQKRPFWDVFVCNTKYENCCRPIFRKRLKVMVEAKRMPA